MECRDGGWVCGKPEGQLWETWAAQQDKGLAKARSIQPLGDHLPPQSSVHRGSFHSSRGDKARCAGRSWEAALPRGKSKSAASAEGWSFTFLSQAVYCPSNIVNFVKPFERLFGKRGSVRTRYSAISILFRREQVKPLFLIPRVTVCLEYWCAASHAALLKGFSKWTATAQGRDLLMRANTVTKYHPHDSSVMAF